MSKVVDPPTDSNENSEEKRPQFGNRFLTNKDKVFEHNAWDNVEWDEELLNQAKDKVEKNLASFVSSDRKDELERQAADQWDKFYSIHDNRFFKDRNWLFTEFPELGRESNELETEVCGEGSSSPPSSFQTVNILEVGCGAGNTVFPILQTNNSQRLFVYCCDFSQVAVDIVKNHEAYDDKRCLAFQWDLTETEKADLPFQDGTIGLNINADYVMLSGSFLCLQLSLNLIHKLKLLSPRFRFHHHAVRSFGHRPISLSPCDPTSLSSPPSRRAHPIPRLWSLRHGATAF